MRTPEPPSLIAGPYRPPAVRAYRPGRTVGDLLRGEVTVCGVSDTPIQWPTARTLPHSKPMPVMTREMARAVQVESVEAVVYHWGVSRYKVRRWRHALGVARFNDGTLDLWRRLAPKLHTPDAKQHQREAMALFRKVRQLCPKCGAEARARLDTPLACGRCMVPMVAEQPH